MREAPGALCCAAEEQSGEVAMLDDLPESWTLLSPHGCGVGGRHACHRTRRRRPSTLPCSGLLGLSKTMETLHGNTLANLILANFAFTILPLASVSHSYLPNLTPANCTVIAHFVHTSLMLAKLKLSNFMLTLHQLNTHSLTVGSLT